MIGTKLYKNNKDDMAQYTATAIWCNANNAHIEDKDEYYEVCENVIPEPTTDEKIAALDAQYDNDKDMLAKYYLDAVLSGDADLQDELKAELDALNAQYETARKEIEE
jgi:hypothetical protein